jgi:tetratricopeptide (TPR) repeat protein
MDDPAPQPRPPALPTLGRVLRRETLRLIVLIAVAAGAMAATRAIAERSRALERSDALVWFDRGAAALTRHDAAGAVSAFRRAALNVRGERRYVLALADALGRTGDHDAAERALLALRSDTPEDPDVNLALARVAAARGDVAAAVRYYQHALYAPWPDVERRRDVRRALIRFLLDHGRTTEAIAETLAAAADVPPVAAAHVELGELFARAGDPARALDQFTRALARDATTIAARVGAGRAAFALGDYAAARRYLQDADDPDAARLAAVAAFVLTRDPLASRLAARERRRRLEANLARARERIEHCLAVAEPDTALAFKPQLAALNGTRQRVARDEDLLEAALDLVARVTAAANARCGEETPLDRALVIIAERHGLQTP